MNKAVWKWINNIVSTILFLTIIVMLVFLVYSKISGGGPKVFGKELLTVLSGSMEPSIQTGSIIAITPTEDPKAYEKGDVITYRSFDNPNVLITHRIQEIINENAEVLYITKGDNNDAIDATPIPSNNVVGKYADFTIPYAGYILNFVKSKIGTILLVIIPGILLIIWSIFSVWQAIARMDDPKAKANEDHSDLNIPNIRNSNK